MTLPRHLSLVLAPNHRSLERSNDGRRTTLHGFPGKLSDESFGSPSQQTTYYYALCGRDLYTVLWLDAAERIADALADAAHAADFQTCTTMNTYQRSDAEIDAALALLPPELRRLTPHTCAPAVVRLLEEKRKPPPVPGYRANPASANSDLIRQLAEEAIERARNGAAFVIRKLPPDTVPDLQPDGGIDVSLDLETLAQKEPAALWISSLLLLRHNGRWHSLEHEFFDCPGLVTRQRLYLQPPEDAQFDAAQWQRACNSLSFIESGDGLGIDWVGLMFLED
ncbi:MAG: hypothetical protein LBR88_08685 [Zoogloeaceae bacterium]|nr:hypothetical protein [Zoogloeaceae bacterium]